MKKTILFALLSLAINAHPAQAENESVESLNARTISLAKEIRESYSTYSFSLSNCADGNWIVTTFTNPCKAGITNHDTTAMDLHISEINKLTNQFEVLPITAQTNNTLKGLWSIKFNLDVLKAYTENTITREKFNPATAAVLEHLDLNVVNATDF